MDFKYKALDSAGKLVRGALTAPGRDELMAKLSEQGLTLLDLQEHGAAEEAVPEIRGAPEWFGISRKAVVFFTRQFSSLLEAGVSVLQCLEALQRQTSSRRLARALRAISADVQRGLDLSESFSRHPQAFDGLYVNMVRVGETTGNLADAMGRLAEHLEKADSLRRKIRSAMAYPVVVLTFSCILVYAMVVYLLPGFTPIFISSGLNLDNYPITQALMWLSGVLGSRWFILLALPVLAMLVVGARYLLGTRRGSVMSDSILFHTPLLGNFVQLAVMSRVAHSLATLTSSGVPIVRSLELIEATAGNAVVAKALAGVRKGLQGGEDLATTFARARVFPPLLIQMVAIGEQSGDLSKMLLRIAKYYEEELDASLSTISSLIEPIMMIGVGGVVFFFVLGVLLPIMGIVAAVQNQV